MKKDKKHNVAERTVRAKAQRNITGKVRGRCLARKGRREMGE